MVRVDCESGAAAIRVTLPVGMGSARSRTGGSVARCSPAGCRAHSYIRRKECFALASSLTNTAWAVSHTCGWRVQKPERSSTALTAAVNMSSGGANASAALKPARCGRASSGGDGSSTAASPTYSSIRIILIA